MLFFQSKTRRISSVEDFIKPQLKSYSTMDFSNLTTCSNNTMVGASSNILLPFAHHKLLQKPAPCNNVLLAV